MDFFECLVSIKKPQKERIGGGIAFHGVPTNNCKKLLVFKVLHDQGQHRVLEAVQTCQVLHQFWITLLENTLTWAFFFISQSLLWCWTRMEASATSQLPKGVLSHSSISVGRY